MPIIEVEGLGRVEIEGDTPNEVETQAIINALQSSQAREPSVAAPLTTDSEEETTIGGQIYETAKAIPRGFVNSFMSAGEGLAALADTVTDSIGLEDAIDSGDENWLIEKARAGRDRTNQLIGADSAYREKWMTKFGEGLGSFLSFLTPTSAVKLLGLTGKLAVGVGKGVPAGIAVGGGAGDQARRIEMARAQGIDISDAQETGAIIAGAFVGLSELLPVERLLKNIGKNASKSFKEKLYQAIKQGGVEAVQEVTAAWAQNAIEAGVYNENLPEGESLWDDFTVGGAVGFASELVINAVAGRRRTTTTAVEREKESELRKREDKQVAEFISGLDEEGTPADVVEETIEAQNRINPAQISNPNEQAFNASSEQQQPVSEKIQSRSDPEFVALSEALDKAKRASSEAKEAFDAYLLDHGPELEESRRAEASKILEGEATTDTVLADIIFKMESTHAKFNEADNAIDDYIQKRNESAPRISARTQIPSDTVNDIADDYARLIAKTMGSAFPNNTDFAIKDGKTVDGEARFIVTDSSDTQYGTPQLTYNNAALLAYSLNNQLIDHNIREGVKTILHVSPHIYNTVEQAEELYRYGLRTLHPDFNTFSSAAINQAANTTIAEGYEEGLSAVEAIEGGKKLTAAQKINKKRLKQGLSEQDSFTVGEARLALKENFGKLGLYTPTPPSSDPRLSGLAAEISARLAEKGTLVELTDIPISIEKIKHVLETKNISSEIDSQEMKALMKAFVGQPNINKMDKGELRLLFNRLVSMPRLSVLSKLPVFEIKPYTREEFARAVTAVEQENDASIEVISAATNISLEERGGKTKLRKIKQDLSRQGLSQRELNKRKKDAETAPVAEEAPVIAGLLPAPDNGLTELRIRLRDALDRIGLKDISLRLDKELTMQSFDNDGNPIHEIVSPDEEGPYQFTQGHYAPALKTIFLGLDNARMAEGATPSQREDAVASIMDHEMVHAMRMLDLWTAKEWLLLENLARRKINKETGTTYVESAAELYGDPRRGEVLTPVGQMEEAIAEMFRHARQDNTIVTGKPRSLLQRIYDFMERLGSAMNGTGFQSFNDIISRVNSGDVGGRGRGEIRTLRATEAEVGAVPERDIGRYYGADVAYEGKPVARVTQERPDFLEPSLTPRESRASRAAPKTNAAIARENRKRLKDHPDFEDAPEILDEYIEEFEGEELFVFEDERYGPERDFPGIPLSHSSEQLTRRMLEDGGYEEFISYEHGREIKDHQNQSRFFERIDNNKFKIYFNPYGNRRVVRTITDPTLGDLREETWFDKTVPYTYEKSEADKARDIQNKYEAGLISAEEANNMLADKGVEPSLRPRESRAPIIYPGTKTAKALDALMQRTNNNPSSRQLANIDGAPKKTPKLRNTLHRDVRATSMAELRRMARVGLKMVGPQLGPTSGKLYWYNRYGLGIEDVVGTANMDEASVIFGITSQQQPPEVNLSDTFYIMRTAREINPVEDSEGFRSAVKEKKPNGNNMFISNNQIDRIIRMYKEGIVRTGALKTTTFGRLTRDRVANVFSPYSVQDVHMARVFGHRQKKKKGKRIVDDAKMPTSDKAYQYAEYLTSKLAAENNVTPDQMQSALWFYGKKYLSPVGKHDRFTGTWESTYKYTEKDRMAIEAQVEQGIFNKNEALTPALAKGLIYVRKSGKKEIPLEDVRPRLTEKARKLAPEIRVEAAPGSKRGYGFPARVTLKEKVDFNKEVREKIIDADGQIPTLRVMGIPHEVKLTYGTYDSGLVPGISVKLLGGNLDQASMAASVLGDALLQDSAVIMQPSPTGDKVGYAVRKANGEAFTEDELVTLAESVNPEHDPDGLNFSQTEPDTAIFMDSRQYWDKDYFVEPDEGVDSPLDQFYTNLTSKLPASLDLITGAYQQNGDLIEAGDYQKGIAEIWDQGIITRRSDLYQWINDTLYQPIWDAYKKEAKRLEFIPKNDQRPTIAKLLGFPTTSDFKSLPEEGVAAAVEAVKKAQADTKPGAVARFSVKASEEAQYIGQNPEKGITLPENLRSKFSRANVVPLGKDGEDVRDRLIGGKGEKDVTPGETYIEATEGIFSGTFNRMMLRFRAAAVNQYAAIEKMNQHKLFKGLLADSSSIASVLFADRSRGTLAAALKFGVVTYQNGVTRVRPFVHNGKQYRGLIDVMAQLYKLPSSENLEELAQMYAISRRAGRLNNQGKITPQKPEDQQADKEYIDAEIKKYLNPETGRPIVEEWYEVWQAYNQQTVKFLKDTGVLSDAQGDHWMQHSDYYPFYKQDHSKKINLFAAVGKSQDSAKPIDVPMLNAITQNLSTAINLGMRNVANQRVVRDAAAIGIARDAQGISTTGEDHIIHFRVNGQPRRFIFDDPLLYESLRTLSDTGLGPVASAILGGPSTLLRAMVTRDPGFIIANMMRDTLSAYVTSGSDFTPGLDTLRGFTDGMETLESYGVAGGYDFKDDPLDIVKYFTRESRRRGIKSGKLGKAEELFELPGLKLFKQAWHLSGQASTRSDVATRNAVYNDVLARTGNEAEAAFQALEIINFSRRGGNVFFRHVFAATPFLNARIQGLDVLYRAFIKGSYSAKQEVSKKKIILTAMTRGVYLTGLTALYWTMISDDDEYKKVSQHERDNYWLFPKLFGKDSPAFRVPIPFEVGIIFKVIPERILDYLYGSTTPRQLRQSMERSVKNTLAMDPVYNTALWGPFLQAYTNKNAYTGQPIVPIWMQGDIAPGFQSTSQTNALARSIGETLNISPLKIEHMVSGYTGTLGTYALSMIDSTLRHSLDQPVLPKKEIYEYPVVKRFFSSKEGRGLQEQYYELKKETNQFTSTLRDLDKKERIPEYEAFIKSRSYMFDVMDDMDSLDKHISDLRKYKNSILSSDYFDAEHKAEVKREVDSEINKVLHNIPELMRRAKLPAFGSPLR